MVDMFVVAVEGAREVFVCRVVVRVAMPVWYKEGKEKVSRGTRLDVVVSKLPYPQTVVVSEREVSKVRVVYQAVRVGAQKWHGCHMFEAFYLYGKHSH